MDAVFDKDGNASILEVGGGPALFGMSLLLCCGVGVCRDGDISQTLCDGPHISCGAVSRLESVFLLYASLKFECFLLRLQCCSSIGGGG